MEPKKDEPKPKEIPNIIIDPFKGKKYQLGKFLGRGGFAKCYEIIDDENNIFACKIVPKQLLTKKHQKEKMVQEIAIHKSLRHKHIVEFYDNFENKDFVFIVLELCRRRSLMELHKRRKCVSEPEARYFCKQIILACQYLHDNKIIHRDLKLGNLFLNEDLEIKIGDFGLATRIDKDGDRKLTLCGTPNYIAPEVLSKKGHSFEVDAWSLGCIVYTLIVGRPPFETGTLKETYHRIRANEYVVPLDVTSPAKDLIIALLRSDPSKRPKMCDVLNMEFFKDYIPDILPISCLSTAPRFSIAYLNFKKPLNELDMNYQHTNIRNQEQMKNDDMIIKNDNLNNNNQCVLPFNGHKADEPKDCYFADLGSQLKVLFQCKPWKNPQIVQEDAEHPASIPIFWVSKWVDYTDKYGLGYQLSDGSVGILYNDNSRLLLYEDLETLEYIDKKGQEEYFTFHNYPEHLKKKATILNYFQQYMNENLIKTGASMAIKKRDDISRLPFLRVWHRTENAIFFHLTNGTLQVNFFSDHTKLIVCPLMQAVSYIDKDKNFTTYKFSLLKVHGMTRELAKRLIVAENYIAKVLSQ
ncbi:unnamed protein product [Gordionus sp. m RMFG-2023]|uniref:serine/threonine-protein kinase PLK1-like n=1 Tax=Gordionus sp. m RMFG-2023 TaxID=3053472 RepID=UPI0030E0D29E